MRKQDYDVVFLGGLFPKETEHEIISNSIGQIDNAANSFQWSLINGLDTQLMNNVTIINSLYIGAFPYKYSKLCIASYNFKHDANSKDKNTGFINLAGLKHFSKYLSIKPEITKWAQNNSGKKKIVIGYSLTNVVVAILRHIKNTFPDIITVIVVPDLPQYMNTSKKRPLINRLFKKISISHINENIYSIDGFVLLTKHMAGKLHIDTNKTVIIEGIANDSHQSNNLSIPSDTNIITVAYTGALNERYGVTFLVQSFMLIHNINYRLVLCGAGDSERFITESAKHDSRIIYRGQLQRDEILNIQKNATVLINPRQNNEEFTKYSFPSKNMEYLSSGRPLIAYKLDGVPDDYDKYIHYVPDNEIETLANQIVKVCSMPKESLDLFGSIAREWILMEKNASVQANKILKFISKL